MAFFRSRLLDGALWLWGCVRVFAVSGCICSPLATPLLAQNVRFNSTHLAWPPPLPSWSPQVTPSALADLAEGLDACANSPTPFGAAVDASSEELDASASLSAWPVFLNLKTTLTRQQPTSSSYYIQAGVQCCQHP